MFLLFGECGRDVGNCFLGGGGMQGVVILGMSLLESFEVVIFYRIMLWDGFWGRGKVGFKEGDLFSLLFGGLGFGCLSFFIV